MKVIDPRVMHHLADGVPTGENVTMAVKRYHEVASLYESPREDDPVVYEVYTHDEGPAVKGNLLWGLTIMKPVDSHGECNMTCSSRASLLMRLEAVRVRQLRLPRRSSSHGPTFGRRPR